MSMSNPWLRTWVKRGVYLQPNGKHTVCVRIDGKPRFRTVTAVTATRTADLGETEHA
jgi:hypothetical protein